MTKFKTKLFTQVGHALSKVGNNSLIVVRVKVYEQRFVIVLAVRLMLMIVVRLRLRLPSVGTGAGRVDCGGHAA